MTKDLLVLSGSPRKSGNSNMMAEFFIRATESKGHTVKRIDCTMLHVSGCLACAATGEVLVPRVLHAGDITATDGRARAAALADAL